MAARARAALAEHLAGQGLSDASITQYGCMIARWWRWADAEGAQGAFPSATAVRAWSRTLPTGVSTRDSAKAAVRWWCLMLDQDDVSGAVERPQKNGRDRRTPLPKAVAAALLDQADRSGHKGTAIYLGLYAGLRVSEMATLRHDGIDLAGRRLTLWRDKNDAWHTVPLHPQLAAHLAPVADAEASWLFPASNQGHINKATLRGWIKQVARAAGHPEVQPHDLRRTAGRAVYDAGKTRDIMAAKGLLGHSKVETTALYIATSLDGVADALDQVDFRDAS